jgi:hypothetical protein
MVREKWVDGEPWWSEYERWSDGQKVLSGKIVPKQQAKPRPAQPIATPPRPEVPPTPSFLEEDARLQTVVNATFEEPTISMILQRLQKLTGVPLDSEIEDNADKPLWLSIDFHETPAWSVMEQLAGGERVAGQWEKSGTGYRLVRNETLGQPAASFFNRVSPITILSVSLVLLVVLVVLMKCLVFRRKPTDTGMHS